ncbi:MAG: hypothetical protein GKS03_07170 [Alphaproteobacteria bacterium]|nr:hypothetical protein [Alphaproteobacteria bacterium]
MRRYFLILSILFVSPAALAQSDLCPPYTNSVRLKFETKLVQPTYNTDISIQDVRQLYTVRGQRISRAHANAIGLTYAEVSLNLSAATRSVPRQRGGYCVYLEEVRAEFGFDRVDVYVGREYRRGTCEYRTILDHENEHVAINNSVVRGYGPRLRQSIARELGRLRPLFTTTVNTGARQTVADLQQRIQPMMDAFQQEQRRRNAAIDTDTNYGALQELCLDWDRYR